MRTGSRPNNVALTFNALDTPTNQLRVLYPRERLRNFTVCHAALFQYSNAGQLVQSIEVNRVLGADHFYVYNLSVSNATDAVLHRYEKLGLLTVMQWQLPQDNVWYRGQNLAINDCVYRNRLVSRYVVIQDTDEFIVPGLHNNWGELIEHVVKNTSSAAGLSSPTIGSFSVETTFHCGKPNQTQWDDIKKDFPMTPDEEQFYRNHSLFAFLNHLRIKAVMHYNKYCKTIVRPELILFAGIHYTHAHRDSSTHTVVRRDLAIVHHYKDRFRPEMMDATILKFKNVMYPRLKAAFLEFPFL
ncbi:unnamed protein product [Lymnaea stagnalis]|uniref:Glycosyltransferase family 92 protein n=1 Tax=Lymnaea stagnalis TaxID=6523 RepID=A0AAV2HH31_LYMST